MQLLKGWLTLKQLELKQEIKADRASTNLLLPQRSHF